MSAQAITLQLPSPLYERFKRRADEARRTVEAELLDVVAHAAPATEELPPDLSESLAQLDALGDETLWRLARSHLSVAVWAIRKGRRACSKVSSVFIKNNKVWMNPSPKLIFVGDGCIVFAR